MQVVALDEGVIVARSARWQTTCTILHRGGETFVVDSPVYPGELEALTGICAQAGWAVSGLLATHGDWDHLLGRLAFPEAALGVAETTAARLRGEPGAAARDLRRFDEEDYVQRPAPLSLGSVEALPVPGKLEIGDAELELLPADGHTVDGMAIRAPFAEVLLCGDYLSPCELPMVADPAAYLATLRRLEPVVADAAWVVPGHGSPLDAARALAILREDVTYVEGLLGADPAGAPLPIARRDRRMREIHAENLERLRA